MPRDGSGTYTPPNPDVVSGETITSAWANSTVGDISTALTDSLSRSGSGGMLAPFENASGSPGTPGITFTEDTNTGWRYDNTGPWIIGVISSVDVVRLSANGAEVFRDAAWQEVTYIGGPGTVPDGTTPDSVLYWDSAGTPAWTENANVTITAAGVITGVEFKGPLTGDVTGNVTGNVTGDVTGNLIGNVTGDVTGNADTATLAADSSALGGTPAAQIPKATNAAGAAQSQPTDVQVLTQAEYDALGGGVDANTLYHVVG